MNLRRIIVALSLVFSVAASAQDMTSVFVDAVSLYNSNQYGRSKELLENIIKKEPANDAAYYYLALCEASLKDADSAIAHLKKAVEIDPSNYWYRERLAMVYEMKGEFDLVIQMYESILKDNPKKTDIHYELLNLYVRQKQFDKALSTLDAIEMEVGMDEQITRTRYEMLRDLGRNEEALKALAEKLDAGQADIFIIFRGADVPEEEAEALKSAFEKEYPATEVILLEGGQPVYDYILLLC